MDYEYGFKPALRNLGYSCSKLWEECFIIENDKGDTGVYLTLYTNCCGSYILSEINEVGKDKGIKVMKDVMRVMQELNRNHVTYISQKDGQYHEQEMLQNVGFKEVDEFRNINTGNMCILWSLNTTTIQL